MVKNGLPVLGTIRITRFPELTFAEDKMMRKKGKGTFEEKERLIGNIYIRAIKWFDNR